jgi:hypothetical protein
MDIIQLGRGRYSDCFVVRDGRGHALALKLSYYQEATIREFARHSQHGDRGAAHEAKDQDAISVSMAMAEVANQFRANRVSPHFVKVYCEADVRCLPLRLQPLLRERLPLLTRRQLKYSHVCLMELFACDLTSFLSKCRPSDATARGLLFQVVYTLACLHQVFPGFRHNDLSTNNVLVKKARHPRARYTVRADDGRCIAFCVACPFSAALADFDFTHVPGHDILCNERVLSGKFGITADPNPSYDTYLLLHTMHRVLRRHDACPETRAFIGGLGVGRADRPDRADRVMPAIVPRTLLAHAYFAPLRCSATSPVSCAQYAMPVA